MVIVLDDLNEKSIENINVCKSDSNKCGNALRIAHYELGVDMGKLIKGKEIKTNDIVAVYILMRAGLFFGLGISDAIEKSGNTVNLFLDSSSEINQVKNKYNKIIIVDAVINTGKTILEVVEELKFENLIIATNVVSEVNVEKFNKIKIYSTRISKKSFKGSSSKTVKEGKGPDTGDRLFNSDFFNM